MLLLQEGVYGFKSSPEGDERINRSALHETFAVPTDSPVQPTVPKFWRSRERADDKIDFRVRNLASSTEWHWPIDQLDASPVVSACVPVDRKVRFDLSDTRLTSKSQECGRAVSGASAQSQSLVR